MVSLSLSNGSVVSCKGFVNAIWLRIWKQLTAETLISIIFCRLIRVHDVSNTAAAGVSTETYTLKSTINPSICTEEVRAGLAAADIIAFFGDLSYRLLVQDEARGFHFSMITICRRLFEFAWYSCQTIVKTSPVSSDNAHEVVFFKGNATLHHNALMKVTKSKEFGAMVEDLRTPDCKHKKQGMLDFLHMARLSLITIQVDSSVSCQMERIRCFHQKNPHTKLRK
ncbi:hypothetical protein Bca4012_083093 [Brassica carinata]